MITLAFRRRRAERFAQLLDEAGGGRRHHLRSGTDAQLAPLVALAEQVRGEARAAARERSAVPPVDPAFRADLRAMLVATAVREGIGIIATAPEPAAAVRTAAPAASSVTHRARTRAAVIVGVAAGTLALSGVSAASGDAVPGDALYGMKRSTERAQLALAGSDVSRGQLYLDFAETRVAEARSVRTSASLIDLLDDMDAETRQGVRLLAAASMDRRDPTALDWVDAFVSGQRRAMAELLENARGDRQERLHQSLALLDAVAARTGDLRWYLSCTAGDTGEPAGSGADALGPLPAACAAPGSGPAGGTGLGRHDGSSRGAGNSALSDSG